MSKEEKEKEEAKKERRFTTISIPTPLYNKIKERIKGTGFTSVSSYVTFVLREVLAEVEKEEEPFSKEDEEKVKARLRALGYLD